MPEAGSQSGEAPSQPLRLGLKSNSSDTNQFEERKRRIDAAAPSEARLGDTIDVLVQVRMVGSPRLGANDFPSQQKPNALARDSTPVVIPFSVDLHRDLVLPARLKVRLVAPHFRIGGSAEAVLDVPLNRSSERLVFLLTTRQRGECRINVELLTLTNKHLRTLPLSTAVNGHVGDVNYATASLLVQVGSESVKQPEQQSTTEPNSNATRAPIIILVTVNDHETDSVLDVFIGTSNVAPSLTRGGVTYNDLGTHGGHRIIHTICEMGAGGIGASQQRTHEAIDHWQPKAIIGVGIAFGLNEQKQGIGDVLVATQLQGYELSRLNANGTLTPRDDKPSCANTLVNRFRHTDTNERRRGAGWPKTRFGLVLCGQKLVDNLDYRESLKKLFPEAIGGEMEGGGLYVSAQTAKVDWLVVKAICDWGHDKNRADKDAWQKLAARNAARVVKAALDTGCLYDVGTMKVESSDLPPEPAAAALDADTDKPKSSTRKPIDISGMDKHSPAALIGPQERVWNHFYTIGVEARERAINEFDYAPEGVACYVFPHKRKGT